MNRYFEYVKKNSIGRPITLEDLSIKEPTKEEIESIYRRQRRVYPKLNEMVKEYLKNQ